MLLDLLFGLVVVVRFALLLSRLLLLLFLLANLLGNTVDCGQDVFASLHVIVSVAFCA